MCGVCGTVAAPGNFDLSQKCCTCYECGEPLAANERVKWATGKGYSLYHDACQRKRHVEIVEAQLEKAKVVESYNGPVYFEGHAGSYGDSYFENVDELSEYLDDMEGQSSRPEFAFCCEAVGFKAPDLDSLLRSATEEMDEDAYERLEGIEELEKAIAIFVLANAGVHSYMEDRKHKVRIPPVDQSNAAAQGEEKGGPK